MQALLAYLVLQRDQSLARQQLAGTFWPDTTDAQARTNLRTLLARLREALPDADRYLAVDAQTVQWRSDAPCAIDVIEFEQALAANRLAEAITLYRGDLLPGCYDDWITGEVYFREGELIAFVREQMGDADRIDQIRLTQLNRKGAKYAKRFLGFLLCSSRLRGKSHGNCVTPTCERLAR